MTARPPRCRGEEGFACTEFPTHGQNLGKSIPILLEKKREGVGVKLHIQLDIVLLRVHLGMAALLCAHTELPADFWHPQWPGAGLGSALAGWALL